VDSEIFKKLADLWARVMIERWPTAAAAAAAAAQRPDAAARQSAPASVSAYLDKKWLMGEFFYLGRICRLHDGTCCTGRNLGVR
jgi:hypothetical protein